MMDFPQLKTSTLIIGAGISGLFTALKMAPHPVTVITSAKLGRGGSSTWAQGGLAAAMGEDDSPALHFEDTISAGAGLVKPEAARALTQEGPARVQDLIDLGVEFDRDANGALKLGREAAHNRYRIVHVAGDQAGAAIMDALMSQAEAAEHITILQRVVAEDLLIAEDGSCQGALCTDIERSERIFIKAPRTMLATGGIGGLFAVTTNPIRSQGHGMAMAFRAGAEIIDPEFVQFHPTGLDLKTDPAPLATEALRGEGCTLIDQDGHRFMVDIHKDAELAPRDVVARGVAQSIANNKGAFLDARTVIGAAFKDKYPTVFSACQEAGIDPSTELMPVAPAVHYHMGGIGTDLDGRTTVNGLWAVGEVASTGIHGANRLASNSLLEALVFGARAAISLMNDQQIFEEKPLQLHEDRFDMIAKPAAPQDVQPMRDLMTTQAGMIRNEKSLSDALMQLAVMKGDNLTSGHYNALIAAQLIVKGALERTESRGGHARTDYHDYNAPVHTVLSWTPHDGLKYTARTVDYNEKEIA